MKNPKSILFYMAKKLQLYFFLPVADKEVDLRIF